MSQQSYHGHRRPVKWVRNMDALVRYGYAVVPPRGSDRRTGSCPDGAFSVDGHSIGTEMFTRFDSTTIVAVLTSRIGVPRSFLAGV